MWCYEKVSLMRVLDVMYPEVASVWHTQDIFIPSHIASYDEQSV